MLKLFEIKLAHAAPKDIKRNTIQYIVTDNEEKIYNYIDKELMFNIWTDRNDDSEKKPIKLYDENFKVIKKVSYKDYLMAIGGEFFEEDPDFSDAYYGVSLYGWKEIREINEDELKVLINLNIVKIL